MICCKKKSKAKITRQRVRKKFRISVPKPVRVVVTSVNGSKADLVLDSVSQKENSINTKDIKTTPNTKNIKSASDKKEKSKEGSKVQKDKRVFYLDKQHVENAENVKILNFRHLRRQR